MRSKIVLNNYYTASEFCKIALKLFVYFQKHADLPWWIEYKECVESVLKQCQDKVAIAKEAVQHHERLTKSGFFNVYAQFNNFRRQKHSKVASWTDGDVGLIRKATEEYFKNLHDQRRENEDSEFICYFEERDAELGGRSTNTLAFVRIHGEDSVSKYNVKYVSYSLIQNSFL